MTRIALIALLFASAFGCALDEERALWIDEGGTIELAVADGAYWMGTLHYDHCDAWNEEGLVVNDCAERGVDLERINAHSTYNEETQYLQHRIDAIRLTAVPYEGYRFAGWWGCDAETGIISHQSDSSMFAGGVTPWTDDDGVCHIPTGHASTSQTLVMARSEAGADLVAHFELIE